MSIVKFLGSTARRWTSDIVGLARAGLGVLILSAVGFVVLLAGALDFCVSPWPGRRSTSVRFAHRSGGPSRWPLPAPIGPVVMAE
jgi:hypothetical protein